MYLTQIGSGIGNRLEERRTLPASGGSGQDGPGLEDFESESLKLGPMVGRSLTMQHLFARLRCTALHLRLATVEGESGTGKMLAAETLWRIGPAAAGIFAPFAARDFLEKPDLHWNEASGGLLYLARVDELAAPEQRCLRDFLARIARDALRTHAICGPLQVVAGASQPLRRLASAATFRSDLASHLTAIRFGIPPLRERREDVPLLAGLFLRQWSRKHGKPLRGFAPGALESLAAYPWPGNVRELESAVSTAALDCPGQWIRVLDLPRLHWSPAPAASHESAAEDPNLDHAILRHITRVLAQAGGNKVRAARMLGISRSTLYRLLYPANIQPPAE